MAIRPNAAYYVEFIRAVWGGVLEATVYDINEEVEQICDQVYRSIKTCSEKMVILDSTWSLFWSFTDIWSLLTNIVSSGTLSLAGWIALIQGHTSYKICVTNAALNFKSPMAIALLNLWGYSAPVAAAKLNEKNIQMSEQEIKDAFTKLQVLLPGKVQ